MAGAGYKLFNSGDVLTAAQVNTYLMEQTVMVFDDAAARTAALSGVVSEGMISYLKDTNAVEVYNGSAWVASDDPNAIQNTIVDAKGDLIAATANDTPARLASSGVNGDVLTVDTSTATGLKWAAAAASSPLTTKGDLYTYSTANARLAVGSNGDSLYAASGETTGLRYNPPVGSLGNPVVNGGFDVWQRGTSFTGTNQGIYTADRWTVGRNSANWTVSRQNVSDSTNLPTIQYCARVQRDNGNSSTVALNFVQSWESAQSIPFAGRTITLSFYARAGANYSAASNALAVVFYSGTGTDQSAWSTYTGATAFINTSVTLTTTWQRFAVTGTIASTATELTPQFSYTPTGTAGANDWFEITGVQVDLGTWTSSTAPAFRRSGGTLAGELDACMRYYQKCVRDNYTFIGNSTSTTEAYCPIIFQKEMRVAPTVTLATAGQTTGTVSFLTSASASPSTTGTNTAGNITVNGFRIGGSGYVGLTASSISAFYAYGSTTVYTASAEL